MAKVFFVGIGWIPWKAYICYRVWIRTWFVYGLDSNSRVRRIIHTVYGGGGEVVFILLEDFRSFSIPT